MLSIVIVIVGIYLTFFTRPRFGVYGLWCGFTVGLGMLSLVSGVYVLIGVWGGVNSIVLCSMLDDD